MSILADPNILLRRTQPDHPSHTLAVESVAKLLATPEPVYFTLQNMSEFWNVATRSIASNGLGFSVALTLSMWNGSAWWSSIMFWDQGTRYKARGDDERPRYPRDSHLQYR
jgi:hypothetical protein